MSSILEALRELDESRAPGGARSVTVPSAPPSRASQGVETLGIAAIGLVVGGLVAAVAAGAWSLFPRTSHTSPPLPARGRVEASTAAAPAPGARPAWLERADPPRARLAQATPPAAERVGDRPRAAAIRTSGALEVAAIAYSDDPGRRSVDLRLDGSDVVTLREGSSARGIEVQLIERDGVYIRRGGDVVRIAPTRPAQD